MANYDKKMFNVWTSADSSPCDVSFTQSPESESQIKTILLFTEIERLNAVNYDLMRTIDELRAQGPGSERLKLTEERLQLIMAENRNLNELVNAFKRDKEELEAKNSRKGRSDDYKPRLEENYAQIAEMNQELQKWKSLAITNEGKVAEMFEKMRVLANENETLMQTLNRKAEENNFLKSKQKEVDDSQKGINEYQKKVAELNKEIEQLHKTVALKSQQNDELRYQYKELDEKTRLLVAQNDQLTAALAQHSRELDRFTSTLKDKNQEIDHLRIRLGEADQMAQGKSTLESRFEELRNDNRRLTNELSNKMGDLVKLTACYEDLEEKMKLIIQENTKLNQIIEEAKKQSAIWREQAVESERLKSQVSSLRSQQESLQSENSELTQLVGELRQQLSREKEAKKELEIELARIPELESHARAAETRSERLAIQIDERLKDTEYWKDKVSELKKELQNQVELQEKIRIVVQDNDRLSSLLDAKTTEAQRATEELHELKNGLQDLNILREKLAQANAETDRLRKYGEDTTKQLLEVRAQLFETEEKLKAMDGKAGAAE